MTRIVEIKRSDRKKMTPADLYRQDRRGKGER